MSKSCFFEKQIPVPFSGKFRRLQIDDIFFQENWHILQIISNSIVCENVYDKMLPAEFFPRILSVKMSSASVLIQHKSNLLPVLNVAFFL